MLLLWNSFQGGCGPREHPVRGSVVHVHMPTFVCVFLQSSPMTAIPRTSILSPSHVGRRSRSWRHFPAQSTQLQAHRPGECRVSCLWSWLWARFESRGPWRLIYSHDKIPNLYCLFICWQHIENTVLSEEQPALAEVGAQAGESWSSHPLSATDLLCGPDKLQMVPHS